jgi:MFS family permease
MLYQKNTKFQNIKQKITQMVTKAKKSKKIEATTIKTEYGILSAPVIVAALGYFVDVYDLLLFSIVRVQSLRDIGLDAEQISSVGTLILNFQAAGLLLGGVLWGVLGDKKGRLSVLFGSIATYSIANLLCGFVHDVNTYATLRFIAGIGLAGELGIGITLVSELVAKEKRGYATSLVAGVGVLGAVAAYYFSQWFDWRTAYIIGGIMGLLLLITRVNLSESLAFEGAKKSHTSMGNITLFFRKKDLFYRYIKCIGLALPTWFTIGVLATFGNEIGAAIGMQVPIEPGKCILYAYCGIAAGDFFSGILSQALKSRKKTILTMMLSSIAVILYILHGHFINETQLYYAYFAAGFALGYWAMFITVTAEQFGTNIRATATTSVPNMVRGTVIFMTSFYQFFKPLFGVISAATIVGVICMVLALISLLKMSETFGKDLDYLDK